MFISSPLCAALNQNGDFQLWAHTSINGRFNPKYGVYGAQEFRFGNDCSEFYQQFSEVMLTYYGSHRFELAAGYRQFYSKEEETSKWTPFCIPQLDIKFIFQNQSWRFENRNRIQYILGRRSGWVYWPAFNVDTPFYYKRRDLRLYLTEEFFWHESRGIDQNRFKIGFKFESGKHTTLAAAYMLRNLKRNSHWTHQNVLHLSANFSF